MPLMCGSLRLDYIEKIDKIRPPGAKRFFSYGGEQWLIGDQSTVTVVQEYVRGNEFAVKSHSRYVDFVLKTVDA